MWLYPKGTSTTKQHEYWTDEERSPFQVLRQKQSINISAGNRPKGCEKHTSNTLYTWLWVFLFLQFECAQTLWKLQRCDVRFHSRGPSINHARWSDRQRAARDGAPDARRIRRRGSSFIIPKTVQRTRAALFVTSAGSSSFCWIVSLATATNGGEELNKRLISAAPGCCGSPNTTSQHHLSPLLPCAHFGCMFTQKGIIHLCNSCPDPWKRNALRSDCASSHLSSLPQPGSRRSSFRSSAFSTFLTPAEFNS